MAEIITITNQKGGVGKTTTASALICGLHQRGARVLGIDLDPQGNLGFNLGLDIGEGYTVCDVLKGNQSIENAIVSSEYGDILPADITLSAAEAAFNSARREFMLDQCLRPIRKEYDFIIIDTPPSLNVLTINAYVATDSLIVPMEAEILSLVGITQLQETIISVRDTFNPHLKVLGILLNKFNPRLILSQEVLELAQEVARQLDSRVFETKIRRSINVAEAPAHGQSVITYAPRCKPAEDLQEVVAVIAGDRFPLPSKK